jgi:hypothetical protein
MERRARCGAWCIAPSISSPIPGMPDGKLLGIFFTSHDRCAFSGAEKRGFIFQRSSNLASSTSVYRKVYVMRLEASPFTARSMGREESFC